MFFGSPPHIQPLYTGAVPLAKRIALAPGRNPKERNWEIGLSRLISWLFIILALVVVVGAVALSFVDIPYQRTHVEQPVSNETLSI
jgi:hypothetical protein